MNATKRFFLVLTVMCGLAGTMASCEDCEECEAANSNQTQEFCDDELDAAKDNPGWNC